MHAKILAQRSRPYPILPTPRHLFPPPPAGKRAPAPWTLHEDAPPDKRPSPQLPRRSFSPPAALATIPCAPDRPPLPSAATIGPRGTLSPPHQHVRSSAPRTPMNCETPHSCRPALPRLDTARWPAHLSSSLPARFPATTSSARPPASAQPRVATARSLPQGPWESRSRPDSDKPRTFSDQARSLSHTRSSPPQASATPCRHNPNRNAPQRRPASSRDNPDNPARRSRNPVY